MTIKITIENEEGAEVFTANALSVESAIGELHRFTAHVLPKLSAEGEVTDF